MKKNNINQANLYMENNNDVNYLLIDGNLCSIPDFEKEIESIEKEVATVKSDIKDKENELILKKVTLRENDIIKLFKKFIERKAEIVKNAVYLNNGLLHLAVSSYYDDIHRYKDYSGSQWANNHKQAAYTIKWIVKFKPVQIKENFDKPEFLNNEILDINIIFALFCGFSFLDKSIIKLIVDEKKKVDKYNLLPIEKRESEEKQSFYDKLLYNLRYRYFSGKHLISIFEAMELQKELHF